MAKNARSARGEIVDFDILSIRSALATAPVSVATEERRKFIDTKDGIKPKAQNGLVSTAPKAAIPEAMAMAFSAAEVSATVEMSSFSEEEFEQPEEE